MKHHLQELSDAPKLKDVIKQGSSYVKMIRTNDPVNSSIGRYNG